MRVVAVALSVCCLATICASSPSASAVHVHIGAPAWSPDGKSIAWTEGVGPAARIWIAEPDLKRARAITPAIDAVGQVSWLPHHRLLYWADFRLFRLVPRERSVLVRSVAGIGFALNKAGTRVAVGDAPCSTGCNGPVVVFDVNGRRTQKIGGSNAQNMTPSFSPDGTQVVFDRALCASTGRCDTPAGVWIGSLKSGKLSRVVAGRAACPAWSPRGGTVAYVDLTDPADEALRLVSTPRGASTLLLHSVGCDLSFPPAWSPDGRHIAAVVERTGQLVVADVRTRQTRAVTGIGVGAVNGFAWSPSSSQLLITAQPASGVGCSTLWRVTVRNGAALKLRGC